MKPVLTLDAAQTLIDVNWDPGRFVLDCAETCGLFLGADNAETFRGMLRSRWRDYCAINETREPSQGDDFWRQLASDWLGKIGEDPARGPELMNAGRPLLYTDKSPYFKLYDDVLPALDALDALDIRMAIISNWDYSLHRIVTMLGIQDRFQVILASLEEGVEKPDPRLFHIALEKLRVSPANAVHVGDNPLDDLQGARNAGMRGLLLDRERETSEGSMLHSLTAIPELLGWS